MAIPDTKALRVMAARAADLLLPHPWKLWFWADSIGLEGIQEAGNLNNDISYHTYVYGLMKGWIPKIDKRNKFDYCFAGVALLNCYERFRDPALLAAAIHQAEHLAGFRRTDIGAFMRYEDAEIELPPELPPDHPDFHLTNEKMKTVKSGGPCLFVDTIHFDGPFYSKLYSVTGDDRWKNLALQNILPSVELLFDREKSLFHHFWIERQKQPNGVLWGRGNGWAMLGMLHTMKYLPEDDPGFEQLMEIFQLQSEALSSLQDSSGDWRTVLDDPEAYLETSIAAFVVDGFSYAIGKGWLPVSYKEVVHSAAHALFGHVQDNGKLSGVSYETFPSTRAEHYRTMPRDAVVPWGQGPLIMAISSYINLLEGQH